MNKTQFWQAKDGEVLRPALSKILKACGIDEVNRDLKGFVKFGEGKSWWLWGEIDVG